MKKLIHTVIFIFLFTTAFAHDRQGYIIRTTGDTVKGIVEVYATPKHGVNFREYWMKVKFSEGAAKMKKMEAGEILGFGFEWEGKWYHWELFDMPKNYNQKGSKLLGKFVNDFRFFLLRIHDGALPVYKQYVPYEQTTRDAMGNERSVGKGTDVELYVKTKDSGFVEIAPGMFGQGYKKLKKLLEEQLKLEPAFLNTVSDKADWDDAEKIFAQYNDWKKKN